MAKMGTFKIEIGDQTVRTVDFLNSWNCLYLFRYKVIHIILTVIDKSLNEILSNGNFHTVEKKQD